MLAGMALAAAACAASVSLPASSAPAPRTSAGAISTIQHVVIIMQENRSFDTYFGTFPGANGIPMENGAPTVCVPDPANGGCDRPFHDLRDLTACGPHGQANAFNPGCAGTGTPDVLGHVDGGEIPRAAPATSTSQASRRRPGPSPTPGLGDLSADFDFSQPPRQPVALPVHPATDLQ